MAAGKEWLRGSALFGDSHRKGASPPLAMYSMTRLPYPPTIDWPTFRLARDLAGNVFPVSEAVILRAARKHGIGRKMGA
jgi:hypothetical protein